MAGAKQTEFQEEQSLKEQLAARPKKTLMIPRDPLNKDDVVPIVWNGIVYAVPRGRAFEVPDVIADIWNHAYEQTIAAESKMEITENRDIQVYG
ncbi:hypothetical protein LOZ80_25965 [Paenibacillus sp. HWE-109]|uniref:hypothetical protein n=1 Tax=Paenibacillus sp. HWE-109 TaxID=1306526 RepID=UPI001EE0F9F4|nr:hypothetical protein [Paenibacillus sp. HWE-109]UKS25027.1 hypothetical protein LOZ80_25965 [Paenibacillus sp. HWE-109]